MTFTPKNWINRDPANPLDASGLIDLEQRLAAYTDSLAAPGISYGPSSARPLPASQVDRACYFETDTGLLKQVQSGAWVIIGPSSAYLGISPQSDSPLRLTKGITPPASPTINDLWLSTSVADMGVSPSPADRVQLISGTGANENGNVQEPNLWQDNSGTWQMIYTANGGSLGGHTAFIAWATCTGGDPLNPAHWSKNGPIIGDGAGGQSGLMVHAGVYYEAGTVYIYYHDYAGVGSPAHKTLCASGSDPAHLGSPVVVDATDAQSKINYRVFKRGAGDYVMFFTNTVFPDPGGHPGVFIWQAGVATATSQTGPFTTQIFPILSLNPVTNAGGTDGPVVVQEGSNFVGWYHSSPVNATLPSDIWRATTTSLTTDAWTILDNKRPVIQRAAAWEIDQAADVGLYAASSGMKFAVWDGLDNQNGPYSSISAAPLAPVLKRWDGSSWQLDATPRPGYQSGSGNNERFGMGALAYVQVDYINALGVANVAIGTRALGVNVSGSNNVAVGTAALQRSTASNNTAIGWTALSVNTTGTLNTAVGRNALGANTTASSNTAIGDQALLSTTTGAQNTALGAGAMEFNTTGASNVAIGYLALANSTTATGNVAVGASALNQNTTGASNTAVGQNALNLNTTGASNTAVGRNALKVATTAANNTAVGVSALISATTGSSNTAVGQNALEFVVTGTRNVGVGQSALQSNTGNDNTSIGTNALFVNTTGASNVAVGKDAGNTDGTTATDGTQSRMTLIGALAQSTLSNVVVLGQAIAPVPNLFFGAVPSTALISDANALHFGQGVMFLANAVVNPAANPVGGGILYPDGSSSSAQLKWRDPNGFTSALSYLANGSTNLVAGTKAIANTSITASAVVLAYNISAAGTVGALSVVLNAGVGFTINSTSGTDTSKVFYRIVSY